MDPSADITLTIFKQQAVIEFLTAKPTDIHCSLWTVYGSETVDQSMVSHWVLKRKLSEPDINEYSG